MDIKNKGQGRIFQSPALEVFTKTSPVLTLCTYVPVILFLLYWGSSRSGLSLGDSVLLYLGGLLFWSFYEYLMHRYVFHFINGSAWSKQFHYTIHGIHHEYPRDEERVFMPPLPGLIIIAVLFTLLYIIMGKYTFIFLPGMLNGYLVYSFLHFAIHKYRPPKMLRPLWKHHNLHHYKYPDKAFGVSSMLWDYVFGTLPPKK